MNRNFLLVFGILILTFILCFNIVLGAPDDDPAAPEDPEFDLPSTPDNPDFNTPDNPNISDTNTSPDNPENPLLNAPSTPDGPDSSTTTTMGSSDVTTTTVSSGGGGGGSSSGSSGGDGLDFCTYDWQCSDWSDCVEGIKTRTCFDNNGCPETIYKPPVKVPCSEDEFFQGSICGNAECEEGETCSSCEWDCCGGSTKTTNAAVSTSTSVRDTTTTTRNELSSSTDNQDNNQTGGSGGNIGTIILIVLLVILNIGLLVYFLLLKGRQEKAIIESLNYFINAKKNTGSNEIQVEEWLKDLGFSSVEIRKAKI